jgi:hypothetical protein
MSKIQDRIRKQAIECAADEFVIRIHLVRLKDKSFNALTYLSQFAHERALTSEEILR